MSWDNSMFYHVSCIFLAKIPLVLHECYYLETISETWLHYYQGESTQTHHASVRHMCVTVCVILTTEDGQKLLFVVRSGSASESMCNRKSWDE